MGSCLLGSPPHCSAAMLSDKVSNEVQVLKMDVAPKSVSTYRFYEHHRVSLGALRGYVDFNSQVNYQHSRSANCVIMISHANQAMIHL